VFDLNMLKIMLADDHEPIRSGIGDSINGEADMEVVSFADNGLDAVNKAGKYMPDVIIMDVSMPEMNGIEATSVIKAQHPDIKIIGLSMHDNSYIKEKMVNAGASDFVLKEGSLSLLLETIRRIAKDKKKQ